MLSKITRVSPALLLLALLCISCCNAQEEITEFNTNDSIVSSNVQNTDEMITTKKNDIVVSDSINSIIESTHTGRTNGFEEQLHSCESRIDSTPVVPESIILYDLDENMPYHNDENPRGLSDKDIVFYYPFYKLYLLLPSLINQVEDEYICSKCISQWQDKFIYNNFAATSLLEQESIYSFICSFNLPKEIWRESLKQCLYTDDIDGYTISLTDDEIELLLTKDDQIVIETFADMALIVKDNKFYSPYWIYYYGIDAYKNEGITPIDITEKMEHYRSLINSKAYVALEDKINYYSTKN